MKIFNLSLGQDIGGQQYRLLRAWRRHSPKDTYRTMSSTYTFYPIEQEFDKKLLKEWWREADVVHVNQSTMVLDRYAKYLDLGKPLVVHYHGTQFRTSPGIHLRSARRKKARQVASTLDLHAIAPDRVTWLPLVYEREELQEYKTPREDGIMKIAHAPTNRKVKGTELLMSAVLKMRREGKRVSLDLIEKVDNVACMKRKGVADVYVDQLYLGYGCNAVEAWGMDIPVISGLDLHGRMRMGQNIPDGTRELMIERWGSLPFKETTEQDLYNALNEMLEPEERQRWAGRGRDHFERFHEAAKVVKLLRPIYRQAVEDRFLRRRN